MQELVGDAGQLSQGLDLRNDLTELSRLAEWLHSAARRVQLPDEVLSDIDHSAAERVHNIIAYAYQDSAEHVIRVRLTREQSRVILQIEDDGVPFNPLDYASPPPVTRIEQAPLGGRGIRTMRALMTECSYRYQDGKNILTMVRAW